MGHIIWSKSVDGWLKIELLIVIGEFECLNLLPLDGKRLISRIVSEIGFAVIVSLENKVKTSS